MFIVYMSYVFQCYRLLDCIFLRIRVRDREIYNFQFDIYGGGLNCLNPYTPLSLATALHQRVIISKTIGHLTSRWNSEPYIFAAGGNRRKIVKKTVLSAGVRKTLIVKPNKRI